MGLFTNPLGHAGYPPRVTGTPYTQPAEIQAATIAEAEAGTINYKYISPATRSAAASADFASPPVLGFGSTTPRPVHATTLASTGATTIGSSAGVATAVGNSTGTLGFFGSSGAVKTVQGAITNNVTAGGTTGTIANFTSLSVYATDAPTIQNDIYQLALSLSGVITVLKSYGIM